MNRTLGTLLITPFLALILALGMVATSPLAAHGVTACGGVVRDGEGLIPSDQLEQVQTITDATKLGGANPLIVIVNDGEGALLDRELEQAIATCPALAEDRDHVLALGLVVSDRTVRIHAGSAIAPRIEDETIAKVMHDQIGTMPIEQILVGAFDRINAQLYATRTQPLTHPVVSPPALAMLSVLGILAVMIGAAWLYANRRLARHVRRDVEGLRDRGMHIAQDLERDQRTIEVLTENLTAKVTLSEAEPLWRAQVESQLRARVVLSQWYAITNRLGTGEGLRAQTLSTFLGPLQAGVSQLQQASDHAILVHGNLAHVLSVIDSIQDRQDRLAGIGVRIEPLIATGRTNGWDMDEVVDLNQTAQRYLDLAADAIDAKAMLAADERLRIAEEKWRRAQELGEERQTTREDIRRHYDARLARLKELHAAMGPAKIAMDGLQSSFAMSAWEAVAGHLAAAGDSLSLAETILDEVRDVLADPEVVLDEAKGGLDAAGLLLSEAEGLIDAVHECLADCQHDAQLLPDALRSVDRAVAMAIQVSTAREHDQGIEALTKARDRIHHEASQDKPDLRALINWAELVQLQADQWVAFQRDDAALDAHFRQAARSTVEQARKSCDYAATIVQTNRHLLPESYIQVIEELADKVQRALAEEDPFVQMDEAARLRHQASAIEQDARRLVHSQNQFPLT